MKKDAIYDYYKIPETVVKTPTDIHNKLTKTKKYGIINVYEQKLNIERREAKLFGD